MLGRVSKAPVYAIGPLVNALPMNSDSQCQVVLDCLDRQLPNNESVIYICSFGSGGIISAKQMMELAWGLELSQQRFIWVVRPPLENDVSGLLHPQELMKQLQIRLPARWVFDSDPQCWTSCPYLVPTKGDFGLLAHPSVGGFLSHCGWNSAGEYFQSGANDSLAFKRRAKNECYHVDRGDRGGCPI